MPKATTHITNATLEIGSNTPTTGFSGVASHLKTSAVAGLMSFAAVLPAAAQVNPLACADEAVCTQAEINDALVAETNAENAAQDAALEQAVTDQGLVDEEQDGAIGLNTANIATNVSSIGTNATNISTNTGNITTNTNNITTNTNNIATNTGNITTNTNNITTNTNNIATNTGNIATNTDNIALNSDNIAINSGNIATNTQNIAANRQIASDGIAIALASKSPVVLPGQNYAVTAAFGAFDSSVAFALGGAVRIDHRTQLFGTIGTAGDNAIGASAGVQWNW